jgi:hypothetical protein
MKKEKLIELIENIYNTKCPISNKNLDYFGFLFLDGPNTLSVNLSNINDFISNAYKSYDKYMQHKLFLKKVSSNYSCEVLVYNSNNLIRTSQDVNKTLKGNKALYFNSYTFYNDDLSIKSSDIEFRIYYYNNNRATKLFQFDFKANSGLLNKGKINSYLNNLIFV